MKRMKYLKLIAVIGMLVVACSKNDSTNESNLESKAESKTEQKENVNSVEKGSTKEDPPTRTSVTNETEFNVPAQFIVQTGLTTVPLTRNDDGKIQIPNASILDFNGNSSIFIRLDNNKFALRFISVIEKKETYSLVDANVLEAEKVVTVGALQLMNGLARSHSGHSGHSSHRGHSHNH